MRASYCPSRSVTCCPARRARRAPTPRCATQREPMSKIALRLSGVTKIFGKQVRAVDDLSLEIEDGEFFGLLGPSGCGKTTTLRLIAGLEAPDDGEIIYQDTVLVSQRTGTWVPPEKRQMGMV